MFLDLEEPWKTMHCLWGRGVAASYMRSEPGWRMSHPSAVTNAALGTFAFLSASLCCFNQCSPQIGMQVGLSPSIKGPLHSG